MNLRVLFSLSVFNSALIHKNKAMTLLKISYKGYVKLNSAFFEVLEGFLGKQNHFMIFFVYEYLTTPRH